MDWNEACAKIADGSKSAWRASTNSAGAALDALSPTCAPFAARWDAEADRRRQLRTPENLKALLAAQRDHNSARATAAQAKSQRSAARKATSNPLSATRRAARTADKAARGHRGEAKSKLQAARKEYPSTLASVAVKAHAAHVVPAGLASWLMSTPTDWTVWPAATSGSLIAANVLALWLGRRTVTPGIVDDGLSVEERQLMERLDPSYWVQHAEERGLSGTVTTPPEVTGQGITCAVRLDGKWTTGDLRSAEARVRALLGARTSVPMLIRDGDRGGWARLTLRTRSAADGMQTVWAPGLSWGVDMTTGEEVNLPLGQRLLIAGRSGAGKSVATRPLLWAASEGETDRLVLIDLKFIEARQHDHRARVATTPDAVEAVVEELVEEMNERLELVPKGEEEIQPSTDRPRITVFVDEGAEVMVRVKDALEGLETLARMGRAAQIHLVWATQKPSMSGASAGIPPQIAAQMGASLSLAVKTASDARVVFGDDAQSAGWNAHELPAPGVALLRDGRRAPNPIRTRQTLPADVVDWPARPIWHRANQGAGADRPKLQLVKSEPAAEVPADPAGDLTDNQRAVLKTVQDGASTNAEIAKATVLNPGSVDRAVKALVKRGLLSKDGATIQEMSA